MVTKLLARRRRTQARKLEGGDGGAVTGWGRNGREQGIRTGVRHRLIKPMTGRLLALLRQLLAGVRRTAPRAEPSGEPC